MLYLGIANETSKRIAKKSFQELGAKFYKTLKKVVDKRLLKRDGGVDLVFVDDDTIQAMNKEYRGKDKPTDVISFAYLEVTEYEESEGDIVVGDIFISVDTAARQAKEKKHSRQKEMEILFVHGLLHLFGFDHQTDAEEAEMEMWAAKILKK